MRHFGLGCPLINRSNLMIRLAFCLVLMIVFGSSAQARQHRHHTASVSPGCNILWPCDFGSNFFAGVKSIHIEMKRTRHHRVQHEAQVVSHPSGCPSRSFCGCGSALRVFGHHVRDLWLAANWFRFPGASPAPGMAAVRRHHVFILEAHLGGDVWSVYDPNSGHHLTRIHARSIAGYKIVNPRA